MAKEAKAAKAAPKTKEAEEPEFKYGVKNLIADTGLQQASIRVGLRESDFKRTGRSWGWNTKKDYDEIVAYFKERAGRKPSTIEAKPTRKGAEASKPTRAKKEAA